MHVADQAFAASQRGKNKGSSYSSKQKSANAAQAKKEDKDKRKPEKQKQFCKYYKANDHVIKSCPKLVAKEAKKKEDSMAVADASASNSESANVVQDADWTFSA